MEESQAAGAADPTFSHIPYDKRWEYLKITIVRLHLQEGEQLSQVVEKMGEGYNFHAQVTATKKEEIITALGKRQPPGQSTPEVFLMEGRGEHKIRKTVDKTQIVRYIKDSLRKEFLRWNLPHDAMMASLRQANTAVEYASPSANNPPTPNDMIVDSPLAEDAHSPSGQVASPSSQLIHQKQLSDRATLLIQRRSQDLMSKLSRSDRYWGKGPEHWDAFLIRERSFGRTPLISEGQDLRTRPEIPPDQIPSTKSGFKLVETPTNLCRWAIHYRESLAYNPLPSPPAVPEQQDLDDESTWTTWQCSSDHPDIATTLEQGISSNTFSKIDHASLAVSTSSIAKAVERSKEQLMAESVGFAIMARNAEALDDLLENIFLDGSKTCCRIVGLLVSRLDEEISIGTNHINNVGYSVLDSLFINVLRSHTSITPDKICQSFQQKARFPGEEVDARIPFGWKHPFCHTATQAFCHAVTRFYIHEWSPNINTPKLVFQPLHTLVLITFHLANDGTAGEDLFGALACLVCLLAHNLDPRIPADVSQDSDCSHKSVTPFELACGVPQHIVDSWTESCQTGWRVFQSVLRFAEQERDTGNHNLAARGFKGGKLVCGCGQRTSRLHNLYHGGQEFGILWAAIQTELLTYRRRNPEDPWISPYFSMERLLDGLENGEGPTRIALHERGMMKSFSTCGWCSTALYCCPRADEVCTGYFMNMDVWGAATYIDDSYI
ncbi:hypothetical protein B0T19DRAFT_448207 [Cercophora scortea]|uniref:Clr5 domain-containing protein n=1 Tax=Cercophora scortea TaxID=314031 RepID=A0AAE0MGJ2_9PEZI|nr:hypothetical protein B0T19DRAFT_448207 [Cercophora scortea]